jgi:hypothetical protein
VTLVRDAASNRSPDRDLQSILALCTNIVAGYSGCAWRNCCCWCGLVNGEPAVYAAHSDCMMLISDDPTRKTLQCMPVPASGTSGQNGTVTLTCHCGKHFLACSQQAMIIKVLFQASSVLTSVTGRVHSVAVAIYRFDLSLDAILQLVGLLLTFQIIK